MNSVFCAHEPSSCVDDPQTLMFSTFKSVGRTNEVEPLERNDISLLEAFNTANSAAGCLLEFYNGIFDQISKAIVVHEKFAVSHNPQSDDFRGIKESLQQKFLL